MEAMRAYVVGMVEAGFGARLRSAVVLTLVLLFVTRCAVSRAVGWL